MPILAVAAAAAGFTACASTPDFPFSDAAASGAKILELADDWKAGEAQFKDGRKDLKRPPSG